MSSGPHKNPPPDQAQRDVALDPRRSILVRAPAGSGKTDLLTRRFLLLLGEVDDPRPNCRHHFHQSRRCRNASPHSRRSLKRRLQHRIPMKPTGSQCNLSLNARSRARRHWAGISSISRHNCASQTIDSFCRELALQQPLLSGLGGGLDINEQPADLYRRAARRTLEQIDGGDAALQQAIKGLLLWRDNSWQDVEDQIVAMLARRDQWMQDFVFDRDPDWDVLREHLERPFARHVRNHLAILDGLLAQVPGCTR